MIELVAAALRLAGLEPTWEDVADTLWLAREMAKHPPSAQAGETTLDVAEGTPSAPKNTVSEPDISEPPPVSGDHAGARMVSATLHLPPAPGTPTPRGGLPFQAPAATALPGALALGHALRPLKRRVPSATAVTLDENATVDRAAEEGIWAPVVRPELTRWLDLALVIDQSPSMAVWARTVEELRRLLERHGAFRDVRVWLLKTDAPGGQAVLYAGTESATSHARPSTPRELIDPGGRRLILMVSDCIAPAWSSGAVPGLLSLWGQTSPVVIVNMLPQRLWRYTAIDTEPAELRAALPGVPNARLEVSSWQADTERELKAIFATADSADPTLREQPMASPAAAPAAAVPVPVIALQRHWLAPWASLVAGAGGRKVPAVVTWAEPGTSSSPGTLGSDEPEPVLVRLGATERVESFRARFSPTAFELACYLAAVPLTLPIMRLIQQAMLPGAAQVHLAEVLLGGLLERLTPADSDVSPDEVQYDFADGVRELLQDAVPASDILRILNTVGEFVGQRAGRTGTIPSLLLTPDETTARSEEERAFAAVTARTLRRFGASFEGIARRLEETARTGPPEGDSPARPAGAIVYDNSRVFAVAVAELDGRPVVISGGDATIRVWDLTSGRPARGPLAAGRDGSIYAYAVAAAELDGRPVIAAGGDEGIVRVWDLGTSIPVGAPFDDDEDGDEEPDEVSAVAIGRWQSRSMIISGSVSGTIRVWDLAASQPLHRLIGGHSDVVSGVALGTLQDRPLIVSSSQDGTVGVWDLATGEAVLSPLTGHDYGVDAVAVGERLGRQVIVSGSYDRTIRVWDLATGEPVLGPLTGHSDAVYAVAVAELDNRAVIVSGSGDRTVRVWEMASGEPVGEPLTGHAGPVNGLATAMLDGRPVAVSGGGDATVRIWDLATGEAIGSPLGGHADISTDGQEYHDPDVAVSRILPLLLQNVCSDERVFTDPVNAGVLSQPGCVLASPSWEITATRVSQDYVYNWTRDAAIVALELAAWPLTDNQPLTDYVYFAQTCQIAASGIGHFDRASFLIDGTPRDWTDQADGPALQTLAILRLYAQLDAPAQATANAVIAANLDFLQNAYQGETYNLWEEQYGASFFARSVQLQCFQAIAANTAAIPVPGWLPAAITWLQNALASHWNGQHYQSMLPVPTDHRAPYDPNIDIVMAAIYGAIPVTDTKLLATAAQLRAQWADPDSTYFYPINGTDQQRGVGPMLGRYPGDVYDGDTDAQVGDHPWAVSTANFAELHYRLAELVSTTGNIPLDSLSAEFFSQVGVDASMRPSTAAEALNEVGDQMLRAIVFHSAQYELGEQFDATSGFVKGARNLSWSYASFLSAARARTLARSSGRRTGGTRGDSPAGELPIADAVEMLSNSNADSGVTVLLDMPDDRAAQVLARCPRDVAVDLLQAMAVTRPEKAGLVLEALQSRLAGEMLDHVQPDAAATILTEMPVEEAARILNEADVRAVAGVMAVLPNDDAAQLLKTMDEPGAAEVLVHIPPSRVAAMLAAVPSDQSTRLLARLPEGSRNLVLRDMSGRDRRRERGPAA